MSIITKALRKPSERTTMEATLTGLIGGMIITFCIPVYLFIFSNMAIGLKILIAIGGFFGIVLQFGMLVPIYQNYYAYKMAMNFLPPDIKLINKIQEAKLIKEDLENLIKTNELNPLVKNNEKEVLTNA
jgi:ABC-type siderophore export system fused ATPase/permease subunit